MKKLFLAIAFIMAAANVHAIPGDLNEDGRLNIADQVMLTAMVENRLDKTKAADLNFDDKVDKSDMELLTAAIVSGRPLPQLLNTLRVNQYASGGWSVSGGGLTLDIPGQCYRQATISLTTLDELPDFDIDMGECLMTTPVVIFGMYGEPLTSEASFTLDVPPEHNDAIGAPMLLLGAPSHSPHRKSTQWSYQLIPAEEEFGVTYANHKLVWTLDLSNTYGYETTPVSLAVIYRTTVTRAEPMQPPMTRADDNFRFEKYDYLSWYGIYRTDIFMIELHISVPEEQVRQLAKELEYAYKKIVEQGMPKLDDFKKKWINAERIKVNITKNPMKYDDWIGKIPLGREDKKDAFCNPPEWFRAPYIDIPESCMTYQFRAETCCHELFHYHQYYYANHFSALFLDEMVGSTAEYFVTEDPATYSPDNFTFDRAPINGLYRYSYAEGDQNGTNHHGYNLTPFGTWLTFVKYKGKKFWPAVFSSQGYLEGDGMSALKSGVRAMNPEGSLAADYKEFMFDYFSFKPGIGYKSIRRDLYAFFTDSTPYVHVPKIDRYKQNGFHAKFKSPADMSKPENTRHTFSIQNFGAATMLIEFDKKSSTLYLKDYPNALVTFSLPKDSSKSISDFKLFAVIGIANETTVIKPEELTIDTEANTATLLIPLERMIRPIMPLLSRPYYIGLVATYANDDEPNDSTQRIDMRVDFPGPVIANGLVGWIGDYFPKQDAKATADLAFIPVNGTLFLGAEFDAHESGNQFRIPNVITRPGSKPKDVMFNITGVIRDATATIEDPSTVWSSEFMEKVEFVVSKTSKENDYSEVPYEKLLFDGKNYTPMTENAVPVSIFLPTVAEKNSKFYLKIPNFDYNATLYNISMQLPYTEYTIKGHAYFDTRYVHIINFTIYMGK
ncbi:MAG: dockerin type I repeat-containing protein [Victivallales bacterium]|nr:dockerin type I repeat-containing protein [Victivallales bacterium]